MPSCNGGDPIRIAIASGKGGTGKTLVATNLAAVTDGSLLVDLDVEEPNCHIFAGATSNSEQAAYRPVPKIDRDKCTLCGNCGKVCEFHAIVVLPKEVMVFEELCHGCGACTMLCPEDAIIEKDHMMGAIVRANGGILNLLYGRLKVGEATATSLIKKVKRAIPGDYVTIIDCPPGTACTAVESIRGADICVLVTEPTPFGIHDLKLALNVTRKLDIPTMVFINKYGLPGPNVRKLCESLDVPVAGTLPLDRRIAEIYSKGGIISDLPEYASVFSELRDCILKEASR